MTSHETPGRAPAPAVEDPAESPMFSPSAVPFHGQLMTSHFQWPLPLRLPLRESPESSGAGFFRVSLCACTYVACATFMSSWAQVGCLLGASGVALGAFGAHGLSGRDAKIIDSWKIAATYQLLHSVSKSKSRAHKILACKPTCSTAAIPRSLSRSAFARAPSLVLPRISALTHLRARPPSKDSLLSCDAVRGELRVMQILISVSPAITSKPDTPARILTAATVIFSGSIYGLCLLPAGHAVRKVLGPATPMGGLLFIAGWLSLGFSTGLRTSR